MNNFLIFGDSIALGRGVSKNKNWAFLLTNKLNPKNITSGLNYNLAKAGESTQELLKRFKNEIKTKFNNSTDRRFDFIAIAIGINDAKSIDSVHNFKTPLKIFRKNINKLIDFSRQYSDNIFFIGPTPVDELKTTPLENLYFYNKNIANYNLQIKNICCKKNIPFIEIYSDWIRENYKKYLLDDGLHLNELGHKQVFKKIYDCINKAINNNLDYFHVLKNEYNLSNEDVNKILHKFTPSRFITTNLVIGNFFDIKPSLIIGAPCIRKDIDGISLNTFYQIFIPLKVAQKLGLPCKIFIGEKEEIMFQPQLYINYRNLRIQLEKAIKILGNKLNVDVESIATTDPATDDIITKCIDELGVKLTPEESSYLFNLSSTRPPRLLHSNLRIMSSERVLVCHSNYFLKKMFGKNNFLICEDIDQVNCPLIAKKYDQSKQVNFLSFLSMPNTLGTNTMFKSPISERILLNKKIYHYKKQYQNITPWVMDFYKKLFDLTDYTVARTNGYNFNSFYRDIKRISKYFKPN